MPPALSAAASACRAGAPVLRARPPAPTLGRVDVGIVGPPLAGKSSLFAALTRGGAPSADRAADRGPAAGVASLPDERLDRLAAQAGSKRVTHAAVRWLDFPAGAFGAAGPEPRLLRELAGLDVIALVARAFEDPAVPLPAGGVDPDRDIETLQLELAYADLALIERRLERTAPELRSLPAAERGPLERDRALLERLRATLEEGGALRGLDLNEGERRLLAGYRFATAQPLLVVVNVGEADAPDADAIVAGCARRHGAPGVAVVALSAKLEAELAALAPDEAAAFRRELGLPAEPPAERIAGAIRELLGAVAFFTVGDREARAWTLRRGGSAFEAAQRIHSDLGRGFIRAEVARWDELLEAGSEAALRKQGRLRVEGRDYEVRDGDVLHVLFNV